MKTIETPIFPLVSATDLHQNLTHPQLVLLDATMPKPGEKQKYIPTEVISQAQFFDIEEAFSDTSSPFPHTMPSVSQFEKEAQKLSINQDSWIVVYDIYGYFSAPRAWWMFKAMGFDNVCVLDGGLPAWKSEGYKVNTYVKKEGHGNFKANVRSEMITDKETVRSVLADEKVRVLDARSKGRFDGTEPEPRAGLRSGHMPNAKSLPFTDLLSDGKMKSKEQLESIFGERAAKEKALIFSCGSGVTACVLALGATIAGYDHLCVYDGSWSEWGQALDFPVTKE